MTLRGLYAITPALEGEALLARVRSALEGAGPGCVLQYRGKTSDASQRLQDARALAALCRMHGATYIVNDDLELALAVNADGLHLGREDGEPAAARARLGARLLGVSCYDSLERARAAVAAGADYVAFGSVFSSSTKPGAVRAPLALFAAARPLGVPLVAIGGITLENAPQLLAAGVDCVAVISDLFEARDISSRARAFTRLFHSNALSTP